MLLPHLWADPTSVCQTLLWLLGGGRCSAHLRNGISCDWEFQVGLSPDGLQRE